MFYDRLQTRCEEMGIKITPLVNELGISSGSISRWKAGTLPNGETLLKLASRLDCSVDYLLGRDEQQKKPTPKDGDGLDPELVDLINRIPADRMPEVERYLRFQAEQGEKP